jgi:IS5 family transposase
LTVAEAEYQNKKRKTRRELFMKNMDALISWVKLEKKLCKYYPKDEMGSPPCPLS